MEKIYLSYEMKLINLLGYSTKKMENGSFIILDDESNEVGYIKCKRINKGNEKTFGFDMLIDSSKIKFHSYRSLNDNKTSYEINIKDDNNTRVELDLGKNKVLTIWSNNSFSNLNVDSNRLYLHLESDTENYKTEETFTYKNKNRTGFQYSYQINYSHKENKTDRGIIEVSAYETDPNHIKITDIEWFYGHKTRANTTEVEGNLDDMNKVYSYGTDLFKHYHYLTQKLLPFKTDILEEIFTDEIIDENSLDLFISKKENEQIKK